MGSKINKDPNMSRIKLLPDNIVRKKNYKTNGSDFITISGCFYGDKFILQDSSTQTRKFNFTWSCIIPFIKS